MMLVSTIEEATHAARELAGAAAGRSDGVWLAAIVICGAFALLGLLFRFVVVPWGKSQIDISQKRAEAEEKRSEELATAVRVLCEVSGKSHVLAQSTDDCVSRIEKQLVQLMNWKRAATEALESLAEASDKNPRLRTALGVMRGSLMMSGEPATAELPPFAKRG